MYHEALEEVNNVKSEYEAKLMTANDSLAVAMSENEVLKEKVDILFKLGRSYLNREKVGNNENNNKDNNANKDNITNSDDDIIEVGRDENIEDLGV